MKRIVCAGTFDRLHTGHLEYFRKAKALSLKPWLIVIVARDANSERIKGKKTVNDEKSRLKRVRELGIADEVVLGFPGDFVIDRIVSLKPDVIALGFDQWVREDWLSRELEDRGMKVKIVRMSEFEKRFFD